MIKELITLFPSFEQFTEYPAKAVKGFYIFQHPEKGSWFRIQEKEVSERDYALLTALFQEIKTAKKMASSSAKWLVYLENGENPPVPDQTEIRVVQLFFSGQKIGEEDFKEASCAFFGDSIQLLFISPQQAFLIESKSCTAYDSESFSSFMNALESDFYIKAKMYIGKFQLADSRFPLHFRMEKEWFQKALMNGSSERLYTMEKLFPMQLMEQMPDALKEILVKEVLDPLGCDQDILQTVRAFFENGFNATIASKKLYIHRNTLQYRLNKFQEITGISLRDFNGALVAYCASIAVQDSKA